MKSGQFVPTGLVLTSKSYKIDTREIHESDGEVLPFQKSHNGHPVDREILEKDRRVGGQRRRGH